MDRSRDPVVSAIDATWFGAGLAADSQARLADISRRYQAPSGAVLLREGAETRELSLLVHGRVGLSVLVRGHGSVTLISVEPGDIFGWSAVLAPFTATSTVTALGVVDIIAFDGALLRQALHKDMALAAGVYQQVLEAVARRLLATRQQLLDLYGAGAAQTW
jgi:CRP/FNR family cyclic AMP-dependent transcriptional regulator